MGLIPTAVFSQRRGVAEGSQTSNLTFRIPLGIICCWVQTPTAVGRGLVLQFSAPLRKSGTVFSRSTWNAFSPAEALRQWEMAFRSLQISIRHAGDVVASSCCAAHVKPIDEPLRGSAQPTLRLQHRGRNPSEGQARNSRNCRRNGPSEGPCPL